MAQFLNKAGVALTPQQVSELDIASQRDLAGTPGVAVAGTKQMGDVANLDYAKTNYGYQYTPPTTQNQMSDATKGAFDTGAAGTTPPKTYWNGNPIEETPKVDSGNPMPGESYADWTKRTATPTTPTTTPNVLTSDSYLAQKKLIDDQLAQKKSSIEADYARRQQEQQMKNEEMSATEKAVQFRTGQSGTSYATDQTNRAEKLRQSALDQLLADKNNLIQAAQNAAATDNWKSYDAINKELTANEEKAATLAREGAKDLFSQYMQLKNLSINEKSSARQDATATYNIVKDIPEGETQVIDGITYTGVKKPDPFYTSASVTSIMQKLPEGKSVTLTDPVTKQPITITGLPSDGSDNQIFKDVNENTGNVTFTTMDKMGNIVKQVVSKGTGAIFKSGTGSGGTESSAVGLYSDIMKQAIISGAKTSDEVLAGVQAVASNSGVTLSVKELNAIKAKSKEFLDGYTPAKEPEVTPTESSPIEKEIQRLKTNIPNFNDADIRATLRTNGFNEKDITSSSVAGFNDKVGNVVDSISGFLFKK